MLFDILGLVKPSNTSADPGPNPEKAQVSVEDTFSSMDKLLYSFNKLTPSQNPLRFFLQSLSAFSHFALAFEGFYFCFFVLFLFLIFFCF